ncbi:MAG: hypothetical protein B6D64_01435 [Bacteroidetes bacterium 4484_276]|nr:MAG: hypothetical protein B6D64_01435 [Bacteroidetes bacterium 4484_276]
MYLAPLNYDRYFRKVFSELKIAKRFLEDFLDVEIQEIEFLQNKISISHDASRTYGMEFDFRCKIDGFYVIIDMQQWHKTDVVQRFYVYHALNSALQLEKLPKKIIPLVENKSRKVHDYGELLPVITLIWMVHDTFGFTDDYVGYTLAPENVSEFIKKDVVWKNSNIKELLAERNKQKELLTNNNRNLDFLSSNRLIYAFQKNIVKNKKYKKYYDWFELADKTLRKVEEKREYARYEQDKIFAEVIRRLLKSLKEPESEEYISTYEEYLHGAQQYDKSIRREGRNEGYSDAVKNLQPQLEEARNKEDEARKREKEARRKEKETKLILAKKMKQYGEQIDEIKNMTGLSSDEINEL